MDNWLKSGKVIHPGNNEIKYSSLTLEIFKETSEVLEKEYMA